MPAPTPSEFRIVRISTLDEGVPYRASFAGAYQDIFSEPPYNERFFPSEAQGVLRAYLEMPESIVLLAVRGTAQVVGFGIGTPLRSKPSVARELRGLIPTAHTYYMAELGVLSAYRGHGLGRELVQQRIDLIDRARYTHLAMRTSAVKNASYNMYLAMGFEDMGVYMEVPSRRLDGRVTTDRRLFLCKVLARDVARPEAADQPAFGTAGRDFE